MTSLCHKAIKWLLAGATFLAVIGTSGCTVERISYHAVEIAPATQPIESATPVADPFAAVPPQKDLASVFTEPAPPRPSAPSANSFLIQHTFTDEGYNTDVAVDPTGKWLVFSSTRHGEHTDIYMQRVDGFAVTQLTADPAEDAYPVFSPDGKTIAFASTRGGNWDLYLMDTEGRNITRLTTGLSQDIHPSFSPDGTRLVYSSLNPRTSQWELWLINVRTQDKKVLAPGLFPSWSPAKDADRIAFQRPRQRGARCFSLWTLELVDNEPRKLTEVAASSNAATVSPSWSPDGQWLAFATIVDPGSATGKKPQLQQDIWTIHREGTDRRRLTDGLGTNVTPFWAVDGRVYFITNRVGAECVWSVPAGEAKLAGL